MHRFHLFSRCLGALILLSSIVIIGNAQTIHNHDDKHQAASEQKFLGKGDGIETCPVTGESITTKSIKGDFFGRTVYFCCAGCLAKAKKNPELYLKPTIEEQKRAIEGAKPEEKEDHEEDHSSTGKEGEFLGKGDGIETCPVTGEPIDKEIKAEINGRTVYACCAKCLAQVKKNPDLYLKKN